MCGPGATRTCTVALATHTCRRFPHIHTHPCTTQVSHTAWYAEAAAALQKAQDGVRLEEERQAAQERAPFVAELSAELEALQAAADRVGREARGGVGQESQQGPRARGGRDRDAARRGACV